MAGGVLIEYTSVHGFFFNKLVAGAGPKRGDAEPGVHSQVNAGIGIEVAILKQSLETERFFTVNG